MNWGGVFKAATSFPLLLSIGLLIRLPTFLQPIQEGARNAQTACLTANMIEAGRLRLDPVAPWRGNLNARLVQELPVYNLGVLVLAKTPGFSLDLAGRSVSLIFWILGFWLLQKLWRLSLPEEAHFWANLLFVLAPMGCYLSTAFMPETLLQFVTLAFLLVCIRYSQIPSLTTLSLLSVIAVLGLLLKFPAFVHLGLFFLFVLIDQQGVRALSRPTLWVAGFCILLPLVGWGQYVDSVNRAYFPYWCGGENFKGFIQPGVSRLNFAFWTSLVGYNLAYIIPVVAAPFAFVGLIRTWDNRGDFCHSRLWLYLLLSLVVSWLLWAKGSAGQNYYNLPNLVVFSAFFALGMARLTGSSVFPRFPALLRVSAAAVWWAFFLISCGVGYWYLSRPDVVTVRIAEWIRAHSGPDDLILYQPRHIANLMDYEHQPLLSHITGRRTWIWTRPTPDWEKQQALASSSYIVVSQPNADRNPLQEFRSQFKGLPPSPPPSLAQAQDHSFRMIISDKDFSIYHNDAAANPSVTK